jgi:aspartate/methionine/tyrosine aminotransferase
MNSRSSPPTPSPLAIEDFALERFFARWEFVVRHQLSASDVEPYSLQELLSLADQESRALWDGLALGYTESAGHPQLRAEIARLYQKLEASNVLVLAGAEEGIFLIMHALLSPGDHAVVVSPAYQSLHAVPRSIGAMVSLIPLRPERRWELDPDEVADAVTTRTRVIVINFPHSPTGAHIDKDVQRRLVDIAERSGALLFSDEVYRGLEHREGELLPPAADLSERAVSLGVMSKAFALAGLRIGWLASTNSDLLARVARLKDYTTICSSAPSEILAIMALRARDNVLNRSRAIIAANLRCAVEFFTTRRDEVEWIAPRAGSVAFPRFINRSAEKVSAELAERQSVLLVPGSILGADGSFFRLGLGRKDFPVALDKLSRYLSF